MMRRHADHAKFLCIYLREAHAFDVWPIDGPRVMEPTTTEQRVNVATQFKETCGLEWPIAVDGVEDAFLKAYSPWPFRLFVFRDSELTLKSQPEQGTHHTDQIEILLREHAARAVSAA